METLKKKLEELIKKLSKNDQERLKNRLEDLISVYPLHLKHDNIKEFEKFVAQPKELLQAIVAAFARQESK